VKGKIEIHDYICNLLMANGDSNPLADDDSLLLSGRLQSIDAVEIVVFLEEQFGIDFAKVGFDREQIDSVDAICSLVESVNGQAS
jgi:acyl carrier protein